MNLKYNSSLIKTYFNISKYQPLARNRSSKLLFQDLEARVPLFVKLVLVLDLMRETLEHSVI